MNQSTTLTIPLSAQTLATIGLLALVLILSALVYWTLPSNKKAPDLHQAIDRLGLNTVHPLIAYLVSLIWLAIFCSLLYGIFYIIVDVLQRSHASDIEGAKDLRWSLLSFTAITAALGAVVSLPLTLIRTRQNARQTDVAEQGHITDRITKAVEGLGAEKTVKREGRETTEPNLEVRIGALFALERISQDSDRDHVNVMEILCAYIRNNADRNSPTLPDEEPEEGWRAWGEANRTQLPLDVDIALKIIERRDDSRKAIEENKGYRLGLERAPFHTLDLSHRNLTGAILERAKLLGTNLMFAELEKGRLVRADLTGANLWSANLKEANLNAAQLNGAIIENAELHNASLHFAKLHKTFLGGVELFGTRIGTAKISNADFRGAKFDDKTQTLLATLEGSSFAYVDFSASVLKSDQLKSMFGDGSTTLPGGKGPDHPDWPAHWPKKKLDMEDFEQAWRAWQAEMGFTLDDASDDT